MLALMHRVKQLALLACRPARHCLVSYPGGIPWQMGPVSPEFRVSAKEFDSSWSGGLERPENRAVTFSTASIPEAGLMANDVIPTSLSKYSLRIAE